MKKLNLGVETLRYVILAASYYPANQALAEYHKAQNKGLGDFALQYSNELIVGACLFLLVVSSFVGVFYKTPQYGGSPMPLWLKAPICICGGFIAFLYCLHVDKALTLLTPIYVGAMSFISPAVIHLIHAVLIHKFGLKIGLTEEFMKELESQNSVNG